MPSETFNEVSSEESSEIPSNMIVHMQYIQQQEFKR